jgi:hypothetical protein
MCLKDSKAPQAASTMEIWSMASQRLANLDFLKNSSGLRRYADNPKQQLL